MQQGDEQNQPEMKAHDFCPHQQAENRAQQQIGADHVKHAMPRQPVIKSLARIRPRRAGAKPPKLRAAREKMNAA